MSSVAIIALAVLVPVVTFGFIIGVFFFIRSVHTKDLPPPQVQTVDGGRVVEISTRQVSRISSRLPFLALGRRSMPGVFRVTPVGIEYQLMGTTQVPFDRIAEVDVPDASRMNYFTVRLTDRLGVAVITADGHGVDAALAELAWYRPLTPRAWQRIAHLQPPR